MNPPSKPGRGLGRGLASIIPEKIIHSTAPGGPVLLRVPLDRISRNPEQPRFEIDALDLADLADSIKTYGLFSPVLVREDGGNYTLIAGERRWRACGLAGLTEIPVLVIERTSPLDSLLLALVENLQRRDLNPVEEAVGYKRLVTEFDLTQEEISAKVGKDRSTVTNLLRLLRLPEAALDALRVNAIKIGHGKALLTLQNSDHVLSCLEQIVAKDLSVRATEQLVAVYNKGKTKPTKSTNEYKHAEDRISQVLGAKVQIKSKGKGGQIIIRYGSPEELNSLVDLLGNED